MLEFSAALRLKIAAREALEQGEKEREEPV
jgi:hypothetical protein